MLLVVWAPLQLLAADGAAWPCRVLPAERETTTDPASGAKVTFVTTAPSNDRNLYFINRSWLSDGSVLLFYSNRTGREELFGYLESSGHLLALTPPGEPSISGATCSHAGNRIYGIRAGVIVSWTLDVQAGEAVSATVREREIARLPAGVAVLSTLTESRDGKWLAWSCRKTADSANHQIMAVSIADGRLMTVADVPFSIIHTQFSWGAPDVILFARTYPEGDHAPLKHEGEAHCRLWLVDLTGSPPRPLYFQKPGELVSHECWWTEDRLTFCGGHHVPLESHVKVFDLRTGRVSIVGAANWWPRGPKDDIAKRSWWHAAGSGDGRWVVADSFYGDIVLFDGRTTQERFLTGGHRTYGKGPHCHPGWGPSSDRVVFNSDQKGNRDVVIAYVPANWGKE